MTKILCPRCRSPVSLSEEETSRLFPEEAVAAGVSEVEGSFTCPGCGEVAGTIQCPFTKVLTLAAAHPSIEIEDPAVVEQVLEHTGLLPEILLAVRTMVECFEDDAHPRVIVDPPSRVEVLAITGMCERRYAERLAHWRSRVGPLVHVDVEFP